MKTALFVLTSLILIGCNTSPEKNGEMIQSKTKKDKDLKLENSKNQHSGFWVYEEYLKALKQTKSTKKASMMDVDLFYRISKDNSIMSMNLHEGAASNILIMKTNSKGQIFSPDSTMAYQSIEFKDNHMIIENKRLIKVRSGEEGLNELVNEAVFSGEYQIENKTIQFKNNGQIIGLDSIVNYKANLDYKDAGMQYDKIFLQFHKEKNKRTYLYEFVSNDLILYEIDCKLMESDYCLEVEKGEEFIRLIKK